jgi:hypothetical protein
LQNLPRRRRRPPSLRQLHSRWLGLSKRRSTQGSGSVPDGHRDNMDFLSFGKSVSAPAPPAFAQACSGETTGMRRLPTFERRALQSGLDGGNRALAKAFCGMVVTIAAPPNIFSRVLRRMNSLGSEFCFPSHFEFVDSSVSVCRQGQSCDHASLSRFAIKRQCAFLERRQSWRGAARLLSHRRTAGFGNSWRLRTDRGTASTG